MEIAGGTLSWFCLQAFKIFRNSHRVLNRMFWQAQVWKSMIRPASEVHGPLLTIVLTPLGLQSQANCV